MTIFAVSDKLFYIFTPRPPAAGVKNSLSKGVLTLEWQKLVLLYYAVINIIAAAVYFADKRFAINHRRRVPERTLILLGFLGGGAGAFFAMTVFRHKTKHIKFIILVPLSIILHLGIWWYIGTQVLG